MSDKKFIIKTLIGLSIMVACLICFVRCYDTNLAQAYEITSPQESPEVKIITIDQYSYYMVDKTFNICVYIIRYNSGVHTQLIPCDNFKQIIGKNK